jgi:hypothetical protein
MIKKRSRRKKATYVNRLKTLTPMMKIKMRIRAKRSKINLKMRIGELVKQELGVLRRRRPKTTVTKPGDSQVTYLLE